MSAGPQTIVVVPARDEEERIGACIGALAAQEGLPDGSWAVVVVLDGCVDATAAVARRAADAAGLTVDLVEGPGRGVGHARALGMAWAARRLRATAPSVRGVFPGAGTRVIGERGDRADLLIASTDADTVVAPDWLVRTRTAVAAGAEAVGGRITLDADEARRLPASALAARAAEAARRLAAVRGHAPGAEHHQFSGASLALTLAAYDAVGGVPAVAALEDEALERALRAAGLPIAYVADVRVTTSARTDGRVPRGLAQVLRTTAWQARQRAAQARSGDPALANAASAGDSTAAAKGCAADPAWATEDRVRAADGARGDAIHAALARVGELVVVLGPGVEAADAAPLAAALRADPSLQLVRAVEERLDPLAELVARPALNLHAPELAVLASPLTRTWAARRTLLEALPLPHGDAVDLTVLVDTWARHGLAAIAELPVTGPPPPTRADAPLAAYELLAALAARFGEPPVRSSAFADAAGTRRARLDEHAPRGDPQPRPAARRADPPARQAPRVDPQPRPADRAATPSPEPATRHATVPGPPPA